MPMSILRLFNEIVSHPANEKARVNALIRAMYWQFSRRLTGQPQKY